MRAMHSNAGFTWIELVMVLAVMAVLALMAIPALQEGSLRKQVKEGLSLADIGKTGVQAAYSLAGEMPADNKAAGLPEPEKIVGTMVSAVRVDNGAITVTFGNNASKVLSGRKITLRPAVVPDQLIVPIAWLCHGANVPKGMELRGGRDETDLGNEMLPVECRASAESAK
jgi:type IV pilus assembly protein PilA